MVPFCVAPIAAQAQDDPETVDREPMVITEFPEDCKACHKSDGRGGSGYGGGGANLRKTQLSEAELVEVITFGRRDKGMPEFESEYTPRRIKGIAKFIVDNFKGK